MRPWLYSIPFYPGNIDAFNIIRVKLGDMENEQTYTAFAGTTMVASGPLDTVLTA
jgi:hypothetical protein